MEGKKEKSEIREWLESAAIAIVLALLIKFFLFEFVLVDGRSMEPTLHNGDRLIVTKFQYQFDDPKFQEIIILEYDPKDFSDKKVEFVKRIIGLPGDTVEIRDSIVYINNKPLEEDYTNTDLYPDYEKVTVPEGSYFVLGDNRANSMDSRYEEVGFVKEDEIVGKVVYRVYPFKDFGKIE